MKRNLVTILMIAIAWFLAAALWLLSVVIPEQFGFFNLNWALVIICGVSGLTLLVRGLLSNKMTVLKKLDLAIGAAFLAGAGASVAFALTLPKNYVWPIVAVVIALAGLLSVFISGGRKWDEGDNHKEGYKDYRTRKAEEQQRKEAEEKAKLAAEQTAKTDAENKEQS